MKTIELNEAKRLVAEGATLSGEERLKVQQQRLHELVAYAKENSPYFAKLYADVPEDFSLTDLPITQKKILMENYDDWVTDHNIHLQDVLDYVARDASKDQSLFLGQYTALCTSGSTGKPLPMVRDDHRNKIHSQLIAQRLLGGVNMDVLDISKHKRASIIHLSNGASSYGAFQRMIAAHPESAGNLLGISVLESIEYIVQRLNDFQPETLAGYPSVIVQLANEQLKGNLHLHLKHVATSAELLSEKNFYLLREAFQCPVANNYCMTEGGEVAMTHNCPHLHINEDWVIVEPVDKEMRLLGESDEWSEGILVTDLSNFVQPIIRYYVSDVIRIKREPLDCCPLPRMEIRGRSFETFNLCGKTFTTIGINAKAELWKGLIKYQFVQIDDKTLEVRGVCSAQSDPAQVLDGFCKLMKDYFIELGCPDAHFIWSVEPFIPNKRGGKIPVYVNLKNI
jgi:phenylacetate-coenzyme A ligase PaaK-like adenylate-forming protein